MTHGACSRSSRRACANAGLGAEGRRRRGARDVERRERRERREGRGDRRGGGCVELVVAAGCSDTPNRAIGRDKVGVKEKREGEKTNEYFSIKYNNP